MVRVSGWPNSWTGPRRNRIGIIASTTIVRSPASKPACARSRDSVAFRVCLTLDDSRGSRLQRYVGSLIPPPSSSPRTRGRSQKWYRGGEMRAVIQRVSRAEVSVDGKCRGRIGPGFAVLLGVAREDTEADVEFIADRILGLR